MGRKGYKQQFHDDVEKALQKYSGKLSLSDIQGELQFFIQDIYYETVIQPQISRDMTEEQK